MTKTPFVLSRTLTQTYALLSVLIMKYSRLQTRTGLLPSLPFCLPLGVDGPPHFSFGHLGGASQPHLPKDC